MMYLLFKIEISSHTHGSPKLLKYALKHGLIEIISMSIYYVYIN